MLIRIPATVENLEHALAVLYGSTGNLDKFLVNVMARTYIDTHPKYRERAEQIDVDALGAAMDAFRARIEMTVSNYYRAKYDIGMGVLIRFIQNHGYGRPDNGTFTDLFDTTLQYIDTLRESAMNKENTTMKTINTEDRICTIHGTIIPKGTGQYIEGNWYSDEAVEEYFVQCEECGEYVRKGDVHEVDGDYYCDECFDENFVECAECGEIIRRDDAHWYRDDAYCDDCFSENFVRCDHCGDYEPREDCTHIESEDVWVCEYCRNRYYTECGHCGEYFRDGRGYTVIVNDRGRTEEWCYDCWGENTWTCEDCDECYSDDVPRDEDDRCPHCSGGGQDTGDIDTWVSPTRRMNYGFKPMPCLCATEGERAAAGRDWKKKLIFFGTETEIDIEDKTDEENYWSERIVGDLKHAYCKQDCSLDWGGDYSGIEIVTHPTTVAWALEHRDDYVRCFEMLTENGWRSHQAGTCGIHVHISLHALEAQNPYAVNNMLYIYDRFWDNLKKFSRRTESQLSHWARRYAVAHGEYRNIKNMAKRECGRYMAVNLQNSHTVEIRMWRGSLNVETWFATLELVEVITKKCVELGDDYRKLQALTWDELVASDYDDLNSYLKRRGLFPGMEAAEDTQEEESSAERTIEPVPDDLGDPLFTEIEAPQTEDDSAFGFHVGDRVRLDPANFLGDVPMDALIYGTVMGFNGPSIAVSLDDPSIGWCHHCTGIGGVDLCPDNDGRWAVAGELTRMPENGGFNVGDRVRYHGIEDRVFGYVGTVVDTAPAGYYPGRALVEIHFPGVNRMRDNINHVRNGFGPDDRSIWAFETTELERC